MDITNRAHMTARYVVQEPVTILLSAQSVKTYHDNVTTRLPASELPVLTTDT